MSDLEKNVSGQTLHLHQENREEEAQSKRYLCTGVMQETSEQNNIRFRILCDGDTFLKPG